MNTSGAAAMPLIRPLPRPLSSWLVVVLIDSLRLYFTPPLSCSFVVLSSLLPRASEEEDGRWEVGKRRGGQEAAGMRTSRVAMKGR